MEGIHIFMENADDKGLLARVAQGDSDAMHLFYGRHHDALYAFIQTRGGDGVIAEDILHDTMLEVWRNAGKYSGAASVRTWIYTIARNKLVDRMRSGARLSFVEELPESVDREPNAEAVLEASQDAARVRACLSNLKEVQRTSIRLAFYEGLTYEEIGEIENVPAGTIKSRVFHAKKSLLRCLSRHAPIKDAKR